MTIFDDFDYGKNQFQTIFKKSEHIFTVFARSGETGPWTPKKFGRLRVKKADWQAWLEDKRQKTKLNALGENVQIFRK